MKQYYKGYEDGRESFKEDLIYLVAICFVSLAILSLLLVSISLPCDAINHYLEDDFTIYEVNENKFVEVDEIEVPYYGCSVSFPDGNQKFDCYVLGYEKVPKKYLTEECLDKKSELVGEKVWKLNNYTIIKE